MGERALPLIVMLLLLTLGLYGGIASTALSAVAATDDATTATPATDDALDMAPVVSPDAGTITTALGPNGSTPDGVISQSAQNGAESATASDDVYLSRELVGPAASQPFGLGRALLPMAISDDLYLSRDLTDPATPQSFGLERALIQMAVSLVVIVGLIYVTVWLLRRFGVGQFGGIQRGNLVRPISSTAIGPQHVVHLISVGGKVLIVGVFDKGMTLLGEVTDPENLEKIEQELSQAEASFGDLLASRKPGRAAGMSKLDRLRRATARSSSLDSSGNSGPARGGRGNDSK